MSLPELSGGASNPDQRLEALEADCRALRLQFVVELVTLIVFCASLNLFLFRQTSIVRKQTSDAANFVANFKTNTAPSLGIFVGRLQDYARRDPEFQKLLARFIPPAATPSPTLSPVPQPFGK